MTAPRYLLAQATASHLPLADGSVQCVVTSPPYWGLRSYAGEQRQVWGGDSEHEHVWAAVPTAEGYTGTARWQHSENGRGEEQPDEKRLRNRHHAQGATSQRKGRSNVEAQRNDGLIARSTRPEAWGQIDRGGFCACGAWLGALGLEPDPAMYVEHIVAVMREVRRVLRDDGTLWLNLGDSYAANRSYQVPDSKHVDVGNSRGSVVPTDLKPKDLVGIPWRVAFALQADGWWLRSDIVWSKPNPMPESITDRPTKAHEYLFLLTKSATYFYDNDAIREPSITDDPRRPYTSEGAWAMDGRSREQRHGGEPRKQDALGKPTYTGFNDRWAERDGDFSKRNARSVWTIATQPYAGAHFATFPEALAERCILAGSARQACAICGAPWARVTERVDQGWDGSKYGARAVAATGGVKDGGTARSTLGSSNGRLTGRSDTTGWRPTCAHSDGSGTSVVLDPFVGSGTVVRVANRHGRASVGFDLSREYLGEQALARVDPLAAAQRDAKDGGQQVMDMGLL